MADTSRNQSTFELTPKTHRRQSGIAGLIAGVAIIVACVGAAAAQTPTDWVNLANLATSRLWAISSQHGPPARFQFQGFPGNDENFAGVSGTGPCNIWAVGGDAQFHLNGPGTRFGNGAVYHSDGSRWCRVDNTGVQNPNEIANLDGVAALAANIVWSVETALGPPQPLSPRRARLTGDFEQQADSAAPIE